MDFGRGETLARATLADRDERPYILSELGDGAIDLHSEAEARPDEAARSSRSRSVRRVQQTLIGFWRRIARMKLRSAPLQAAAIEKFVNRLGARKPGCEGSVPVRVTAR